MADRKDRTRAAAATAKRLGLSVAQWRLMRANGAIDAYSKQRCRALDRGILWGIAFPTWWRIRSDSGHWADRGRHAYVLSRIDMAGPFTADNVHVVRFGAMFAGEDTRPRRERPTPPWVADRGWFLRSAA